MYVRYRTKLWIKLQVLWLFASWCVEGFSAQMHGWFLVPTRPLNSIRRLFGQLLASGNRKQNLLSAIFVQMDTHSCYLCAKRALEGSCVSSSFSFVEFHGWCWLNSFWKCLPGENGNTGDFLRNSRVELLYSKIKLSWQLLAEIMNTVYLIIAKRHPEKNSFLWFL